MQCSNVSSDIYIQETKHPFHKCMGQGDLTQQNKTQLYTCFKGEKTVFWGCQGSHFGGETAWENSKGGHLHPLWMGSTSTSTHTFLQEILIAHMIVGREISHLGPGVKSPTGQPELWVKYSGLSDSCFETEQTSWKRDTTCTWT